MTHTTRFIVLVCIAALFTLFMVSCQKESNGCVHITQWYERYTPDWKLIEKGLSFDYGVQCEQEYISRFKPGTDSTCGGNGEWTLIKTVIE